jgi:hypothetical protein
MTPSQLRRTGATGMGAFVLMCAAMPPARADRVTECTVGMFCYCVNADLKDAIAKEVDYVRSLIVRQKQQGKAIGYMSIPLSSIEGSYFPVNARVASEVKEHVEDRFGVQSVWLLNPAAPDIGLPPAAMGADYMLMWTRVLEGNDGLGQDFDFVYFVGPSEFAWHFSFDGHADMEKVDAYYDGLAKTDAGIKAIDKTKFRNYYGLRAAVSFSFGSHDEWNIVRSINAKRREADKAAGITKQLGVLFDGRAVAPGLFEEPVTPGDADKCRAAN